MFFNGSGCFSKVGLKEPNPELYLQAFRRIIGTLSNTYSNTGFKKGSAKGKETIMSLWKSTTRSTTIKKLKMSFLVSNSWLDLNQCCAYACDLEQIIMQK